MILKVNAQRLEVGDAFGNPAQMWLILSIENCQYDRRFSCLRMSDNYKEVFRFGYFEDIVLETFVKGDMQDGT